MNYVFAYVFKKDKDDKGKFDLNKDVHKRAIYGSNLKRAISALERKLIEEEAIESKSDVEILDRVTFQGDMKNHFFQLPL